MPSEHSKQRRQERKEFKRRQATRDVQAAETQKQQAEAAARLQFQQRRKRHAMAYGLFATAAVLAIGHFLSTPG